MMEKNRSIRFIDSSYHTLFRIPDGGVIEVTYPDRQFCQKCSFIDEYHMQAGHSVYHICQFAELLERGGASCRPEALILEEQAAWNLGGKGYLSIQTSKAGYDYTVYDEKYREVDGGRIDQPELTMNEARNEILAQLGWERRTIVRVDYEELLEKAKGVRQERFEEPSAERKSALGELQERKPSPAKPAEAITKKKEAAR